ncbi:hypothetical protein [Rhizobium sp. Leaf386]|uniref:hypothetical protein n=1 Tax=Rhizobium sp. Leaf386 TaxID=1736359 RepID=UPI0007132571|nr:hypothetical protein [Rhizobium sp. Leaf386]KQS90287.1 hypothetical protein ASG50_07470 [Rhizobium sp. Leaf386]
MAATQILPVADTAADSAEVIIAAGEAVTVCLKDASGPDVIDGARVDIMLKDDAGQYFRIDTLTGTRPAVVITAVGTYLFRRRAGSGCGVFRG